MKICKRRSLNQIFLLYIEQPHTLKSSSASFGATHLVQRCQEIEQLTRFSPELVDNSQQLALIQSQVAALVAEYERVKIALQRIR
uniref:Hpt domain-containing protein n=1 Tax=Desertifilum tharense IPPAS B-1220 TaxID=1781255 RepID=A0ACD5GMR7_9CYAN